MPHKCAICSYRFPEEYEDDAVVCGACLDTYPDEARRLGDPSAQVDYEWDKTDAA